MLTGEQLLARANAIGSSDAAAILGLPAYGRTSADVWARITGRVAPGSGRDTNATRSGRRLESAVLDWAEESIGLELERDVMLRAPEVEGRPRIAANLDAWVPARGVAEAPIIVEAKTSSDDEGWGPDGSDEVPDYVTAQTAHQALVCKLATGLLPEVVYVAVVIGKRGFDWRLYPLPVLPALISAVEAREAEWWSRYVLTDTCPPEGPSLETLAVWRRMPGQVSAVDPSLVAAYREAADAVTAAEKVKKEAQRALLLALGEAEIAEAPGWRVSYKEVTKAAYQVEASTYRRLDVRRSK